MIMGNNENVAGKIPVNKCVRGLARTGKSSCRIDTRTEARLQHCHKKHERR